MQADHGRGAGTAATLLQQLTLEEFQAHGQQNAAHAAATATMAVRQQVKDDHDLAEQLENKSARSASSHESGAASSTQRPAANAARNIRPQPLNSAFSSDALKYAATFEKDCKILDQAVLEAKGNPTQLRQAVTRLMTHMRHNAPFGKRRYFHFWKEHPDSRARILIVNTGGTLSQCRTNQRPQLHQAAGHLRDNYLELLTDAEKHELLGAGYHYLELPGGILDSSAIEPLDWGRVAAFILRHYHLYSGFVILHGTDTLAYTAAALTFLLYNLNKPVILTASQTPVRADFEAYNAMPQATATDKAARRAAFERSLDMEAVSNLKWACHFARAGPGDVCVFFHDRLMPGPRVQKLSAHATDIAAFDCPKTSPHVTLQKHGANTIDLWNRQTIEKMMQIRAGRYSNSRVKLHQIEFDRPVIMLRLWPGISGNVLRALFFGNLKAGGLVLEAYGEGNGPIGTPEEPSDFRLAVQELLRDGIIICYVTECLRGEVGDHYELTLKVR